MSRAVTDDTAGASGGDSGEPAKPAGTTETDRVGASGRVRPAFAAAFPADPALDALLDAFEAGDFARIRRDAPRLASSAGDEAVKQAAATLLARTRPDPLATLLLVITGVLLVLLSGWWVVQSGGGRTPAP